MVPMRYRQINRMRAGEIMRIDMQRLRVSRAARAQGWRRAALALLLAAIVGQPAAAQACAGDCDGNGSVSINELITGVTIALGQATVSACPVFDADGDGTVSISELVAAVNGALDGCSGATTTITGSCTAPGAGPRGLKPCAAGTPITVFRCDDRSQCLHQQGLVMLASTSVDAQGGWSVELSLQDAGAALVFQASIAQAVVYRALGFGPVGSLVRAAAGRDVTYAPVAITPVTEAAVQLLNQNGFENYGDSGVEQVVSAVEQATASLDFTGVSADMAASVALQTASSDPTVMMVLQSAQGTVAQGLQDLATGNLVAARDAFGVAASLHPNDSAAQLYALFSRLGLSLITDQRLLALLDLSNAHLSGDPTQACTFGIIGAPRVPTTSVDALVSSAQDVLLPHITDALTGLQTAISANTALQFDTTALPACARPSLSLPTLDVDQGDFMALHAALQGVVGALDLVSAYNVGVGLYDLTTLPLQFLLNDNPTLLTLRSAAQLNAARDAFDAGLREAIATVAEIRAETDPQDDDLLVIMPQDAAEADRVVANADLIRQSLHGEVVIPAQPGLPTSQRLNLSHFFDGSFPSLRGVLGVDANGQIDLRHTPDPTFGGIAPDLTQADIDQFLDGGLLCASCQTSDDCAGFGPRRLSCGECLFDCTGDPEAFRCAGKGLTFCSDGYY